VVFPKTNTVKTMPFEKMEGKGRLYFNLE